MIDCQKTKILFSKTIQIIRNKNVENVEFCIEECLSVKVMCILTATFADKTTIRIVGVDFFDCFVQLREKTPNIIYYCKGAKINVYPSSMSRDMGKGLTAYQIIIGKPVNKDDIVKIFDFDDVNITTPKKQKEFYDNWLKSLGMTYKIVQIIKNRKTKNVEFYFGVDNLEHILTATFADKTTIRIVGVDFFDCFVQLREKTPNIIYCCKGAKTNVYPSNETRKILSGLRTYELIMKKKPSIDNLVSIFDFDDVNITTPKKQKEFYDNWLKSLGTNGSIENILKETNI
jgi:hypothetical protein